MWYLRNVVLGRRRGNRDEERERRRECGQGLNPAEGFTATISLMPRPAASVRPSPILYRARRAHAENGKLFKRHVYRHVPSRTHEHVRAYMSAAEANLRVCVCVARNRLCTHACICVTVPSSLRPNTDPIHVSRVQPVFYGIGTFEKRWCARPLSTTRPL